MENHGLLPGYRLLRRITPCQCALWRLNHAPRVHDFPMRDLTDLGGFKRHERDRPAVQRDKLNLECGAVTILVNYGSDIILREIFKGQITGQYHAVKLIDRVHDLSL
jgi:hypothetical protein